MYNIQLFVGDSLPYAFTKEENIEYFKRYNMGDMAARDEIILHNLKFVVYKVFSEFGVTPYDKEDLISIGIVGLIKAVDSFDINKLNEFTTYASKCIINEILVYLRKEKRHIKKINLEDFAYSEDARVENFVCDEHDFVCDFEEREIILEIKKIVSSLSDEYKKLYDLYFNEMLSQKEVAKIFNLSQTQISRKVNKLLNYLEIKIYQEGLIEENSSFKRRKYTINNRKYKYLM